MRRKLLAKKTLQLIVSVFLFTMLLYGLLILSTGDPALRVLRKFGIQTVSANNLSEIREKLGIKENFFQSYFYWLFQVLRGNLGTSFMTDQSVRQLLVEKSMVTILLISLTFFISCPFSLLLGSWIGNKPFLRGINQLLAIILSFPVYWLSIVAIFYFGVQLQWLPFVGSSHIKNYLLPIFVMCVSESAYLIKMVSELVMPIATSERQQIARFRGIKKSYRFYYQLNELATPLISLYGNSLLHLFGGSVMIEITFSMSGLGKLLMDAIASRDYPVIQGVTLIVAICTFVLSYIIDLMIQRIDSRILINQGGS